MMSARLLLALANAIQTAGVLYLLHCLHKRNQVVRELTRVTEELRGLIEGAQRTLDERGGCDEDGCTP